MKLFVDFYTLLLCHFFFLDKRLVTWQLVPLSSAYAFAALNFLGGSQVSDVDMASGHF